MIYKYESIYVVQTHIDLLTDEVNEYANEEIYIFDGCVKIRTANHLTKLWKKMLWIKKFI